MAFFWRKGILGILGILGIFRSSSFMAVFWRKDIFEEKKIFLKFLVFERNLLAPSLNR